MRVTPSFVKVEWATDFFVLEEGKLNAYKTTTFVGEVVVNSYSNHGDYFGEIALLSKDANHKATVKATVKSVMHWVPKAD